MIRAIVVVVLALVFVRFADGGQKPTDQKRPDPPVVQNPKSTGPAPTVEAKSDAKPLSKELSDKLLQYAALQAEKQKELAESKPAKELALISDAIEVLVSDALRGMGLDAKKWGLKRNPATGLLEAVPLAVPVQEPAK